MNSYEKIHESISGYLQLIRIRQWYKNLVVFLALFFSGNLFNLPLVYLSIMAFFSLALVSSANYIINDLVDLKRDALHLEKKFRPLASGKIKKNTAILLAAILLCFGLLIAINLTSTFIYLVLLLILISQAYNFFLKNLVFADILTIATLFVIRAIAGAVAIEVKVSPWLILCPFFLSLFLSVGKRQAELQLLQENAKATREVLPDYNPALTNSLLIISTTLLITSYALYSFLSTHPNLLYTLPFALFVIFRYYYFITANSVIARHPERIVGDKAIILGIIFWIIATMGLVYS